MHPVAGHGVLADGTKIPLDGLCDITFQLGSHKIKHKFLIAEIENSILLGLDFFEGQKCKLDFQQAELQMPNYKINCCDKNSFPIKANVQLTKKTVIPAMCEVLRLAKINRPWGQEAACVETNNAVPGVLVATSVVEPTDQKFNIRLLNYTDKDVELPAGKIVASCMVAEVREGDLGPTTTTNKCPKHLETLVSESCQGFTSAEKARVGQLLHKHQAVFSKEKYDLGKTSVVKHAVPLVPGARPLKQRPYRHGPVQEAEIEKQVKELQQNDLIKEGHGAWSSPVVLAQKKDGSWRFCVDYRKLNEVTHKDAYPLPRIDDSLDALGGSQLFSTLDLTSGYWQVELDKSARERAAFVTRSGLWEWQVLPFGLTSAPSTFERLMETVLRGLHWKTLLIYLDDIIVFSKDLDSHLERLEEVFIRLRQAGLKLKPSKCRLFADRVNYLGHVVSADGVETDELKVKAVQDWPVPQHKKDVRAFLGTCGYYRRFISNYADISRPLSQLSAKHARFQWTDECQKAFEQLKQHLTTAPVLAYPDHSLPFLLDTDASNVGTGAVLSQVQDGQERVVAYYSKMFTKEEANYCVTRQELLAVVKAVKHFRPHLYGREFTVRTDHASLPWLLRTPHPAGQFARWLETLSEYSFQLVHRKGLKHNNADGLSRQLCKECKQCERMLPQAERQLQVLQVQPDDNRDLLVKAQKEDSDLAAVYDAVSQNRSLPTKDLSWRAQKLAGMQDQLRISTGGVLQISLPYHSTRRWRTVCPQSKSQEVVETIHREAHMGMSKTLAIIRQTWYWPEMTSQVRRMIKTCLCCQKSKSGTHKPSKRSNKLSAGRPWQVVAVDLCGPFPETTRGNTQILVLADHFTRWYDAIPVPDGQAHTVARILDERVFSYFGVPEVIHTDQGAQFESTLFQSCCQLWKCKKTRTAPYHPEGNSIVERLNRTLGNSLRAMLADSLHLEWDELVPQIMRVIRATPHQSTGETPNALMLGRETRLPHDLLLNYPTGLECSEDDYVLHLQKNLQTAHERLREQQSVTPRTPDSEEPSKFTKGDRVWLKSYFKGVGRGAKLKPKYVGPYLITKALPFQTYEMQRNGRLTTQHEGRIKLYLSPSDEVLSQVEEVERVTRTSSGARDLEAEQPPRCEVVDPTRKLPPEESENDQLQETDHLVYEPKTRRIVPGQDQGHSSNLNARPRRHARTPLRYREFHLNYFAAARPILGQNRILGGGSVVKSCR